jgi:hypothetical protein
MNIANDDFEYEKQFAASVAVTRYATWDEYAAEQRIAERFSSEKVASIKATYDRWKENDRALAQALDGLSAWDARHATSIADGATPHSACARTVSTSPAGASGPASGRTRWPGV